MSPSPGAAVALDKLGLQVTDLTPALAAKHGYNAGTTGVLISKVDPTSMAHGAGLREGMLLLKVDNQLVVTTQAAHTAVEKASLTKRSASLASSSAKAGSFCSSPLWNRRFSRTAISPGRRAATAAAATLPMKR